MNYEFAHPCDSPLIKKIHVIGGENYFLVCIGNLNYLHSQLKPVVEKIRGLLFLEHIVLHFLPDEELLDILRFPETLQFQQIHGNKAIFASFLAKNKAA